MDATTYGRLYERARAEQRYAETERAAAFRDGLAATAERWDGTAGRYGTVARYLRDRAADAGIAVPTDA